MSHKILVLPGDGVGPEIVTQAVKLLDALSASGDLAIELEHADVGGVAVDGHGSPLPEQTLALARDADAILLGAVGGPKWDSVERSLRPEQGLLNLRAALGVFANLRPAITYPSLAQASTLKAEVV